MLLLLAIVLAISSNAIPLGKWEQRERAHPLHMIEVSIAVKQSNLPMLERILLEVSDPDHPNYGKHLSRQEVDRLVAPHPEAVQTVVQWLKESGVPEHSVQTSANGDFVTAAVPVSVLEQITNTQYYRFQHKVTSNNAIRAAQEPKIPENVRANIDYFFPGMHLPMEKFSPKIVLKREGENVDGVTPEFIRDIYSIQDDAKFGKVESNRQAVAQFLKQYYSPDDLKQFAEQFNSDSPFDTSSVKVVGPNDASNTGVEASLDIQYITAIGNNISTIFYSTDGQQPGNPENEPFLKWLNVLSGTPDNEIPFVISVSYGDDENGVNFDYAKRVNVEFQKAGVRGISILFASGDGGVEGGGNKDNCDKFFPTFPAASPWVTAVGGTYGRHESAASFSTGGFSNYWTRPDYQSDAVKYYLSTYASDIPDASHYNVSGAGFPDVSAQSISFNVIMNDNVYNSIDGTSAAAPTFAGVIALLNDIRLLNGKRPLGFLNPLLYKHPEIFNDITEGSNPGCHTNGFPAKSGWDPVTGLGTPNYQKMSQLIKSLP